ncbi:MAG: threonine transporter [Mariprofundaceae bacterium]|nr:threonine transporter [Mariprofundaceae bacterium]
MSKKVPSPFNSSLESGVRALTILTSIFPKSVDLQRLVDFDYLVVHSGDVNGPESLHAPLPLRAGELLVRRNIVEEGLLLMMSRGLLKRIVSANGFEYAAGEIANTYINSLSSPYLESLKVRAQWVVEKFSEIEEEELQRITKQFFDQWTTQFHSDLGGTGVNDG